MKKENEESRGRNESTTCIAAAELMQRNGMELKSVIMLECDNLETLLQEKDIQADLVCCLQHLQLRFEAEDKVRRLLSNVSFLLKLGGYFFGITPDSSTIWHEKIIGKYRCFWIYVISFFFLLVTASLVFGR